MGINVKKFLKGNVWGRFNSLKIYFTHIVKSEMRFRFTHKLKMSPSLENQILKK